MAGRKNKVRIEPLSGLEDGLWIMGVDVEGSGSDWPRAVRSWFFIGWCLFTAGSVGLDTVGKGSDSEINFLVLYSLFFASAGFKLWWLRRKAASLRGLGQAVVQIYQEATPGDKLILEETHTRVHRVMSGILRGVILINILSLMAVLYRMYTGEIEILIPSVTPFQNKSATVLLQCFEILVAEYSCYLMMIINLAVGCFLEPLSRVVSTQLRLDLLPDSDDDQARHTVHKCIRIHSIFLRMLGDFNQLMGLINMLDLLLYSLLIIIPLSLSVESFALLSEFFADVLLFSSWIWIICWSGSEVESVRNKLMDGFSDCPWNQLPPSLRKDVLTYLTVASVPTTFSYRGFFFFNRAQFIKIFQATYSYYRLVRAKKLRIEM